MQQSSSNIILQAAANYDMRKIIVIPIQDMNKECMAILNQKNMILVTDETSRGTPDSFSGIYLTAAKVFQYRLMAENIRKS